MQRQSSDESYSSLASSPKKHRRSSSFNGLLSLGFGSSDSNISTKSSPTKTDNPLHVSRSDDTIASSQADMTHRSESKITRRKTAGGGEDTNASFCAFELIRQLSFNPTQTKERANTAETELGSLVNSESSDKLSIGLDLELDLDMDMDIDLKKPHLLRRSPSPLLGLKYLPEEDMMCI